MKPLLQEQPSGADSRAPRAERIDAVIICSDDSLLIELGPLLGEHFRTHTLDSPADIGTAVAASRWIGMIDTASLPDTRAAIARLEAQFPHCPLILFVARTAEWNAAVARGDVVAALSREDMAGPRLAEALAAAEAKLRIASDVAPDSPSRLQSAAAMFLRPGSRMPWMAAAVLIVAVALIAWWAVHRGGSSQTAHHPPPAAAGSETASAAASANAPAPNTSKPQGVLELLSAARIAFRDQKLLLPRPDGEPRGDSALELYAQVISQDPGNDEALDGVRRLFAVGKTRIQADIASSKLDDASRLVTLFRDAGVNADELADFSSSIAAARPRILEQRVQQAIAAGDLKGADQQIGQLTAAGADPAAIAQLRRSLELKTLDVQLTGMAAQMRDAISAGNLLGPAPDTARSRLDSMRALSRTSAVTLGAQHELQAAILSHAGDALHAGQLDSAQRLLAAESELGSFAGASEMRRQLQAAQLAAAHPHPVVATPATPSPAPVIAPTPPVAAPQAPAFVAARPTSPLSLYYPVGESARGSVVVEFTLQPNGRAKDITVVQTDLPAIFSRTAINAVARGRFTTRDPSSSQAQRARLRLRFEPAD